MLSPCTFKTFLGVLCVKMFGLSLVFVQNSSPVRSIFYSYLKKCTSHRKSDKERNLYSAGSLPIRHRLIPTSHTCIKFFLTFTLVNPQKWFMVRCQALFRGLFRPFSLEMFSEKSETKHFKLIPGGINQ